MSATLGSLACSGVKLNSSTRIFCASSSVIPDPLTLSGSDFSM
jgi:hypothetical protein